MRVGAERSPLLLGLTTAAILIGKSKGWLSEIESGKGLSTLKPQEYERIFELYKGDKYKTFFVRWIKQKKTNKKQTHGNLDGAIYKFLRSQKTKLSLESASKKLGISKSFLSRIENGHKLPKKELKEKILKLYGYRPSSWKNFKTKADRAKAIPTIYKINIILKNLPENDLRKILDFSQNLISPKQEDAP